MPKTAQQHVTMLVSAFTEQVALITDYLMFSCTQLGNPSMLSCLWSCLHNENFAIFRNNALYVLVLVWPVLLSNKPRSHGNAQAEDRLSLLISDNSIRAVICRQQAWRIHLHRIKKSCSSIPARMMTEPSPSAEGSQQ